MTDERWKLLMESDDEPLTEDERLEGWHFCMDWDGLLVGPGMEMELKHCTCSRPYP
jgi:hypothetical protein